MRNRVFFATLADIVLPSLRAAKGAPLDILFWACSTGCEPFSLKLMLGADCPDRITGIDFDTQAIEAARVGVYRPETWTFFYTENRDLLSPEERAALFEPAGNDAVRVRNEWRKNVSFLSGDLFSQQAVVSEGSFDLVVCNNFLLHLQPESADIAWDFLHRYVAPNGMLAVGGCNPSVRAGAVRRLGLRPSFVNLERIHRGWTGVSGAWDHVPRPAWAYPEPALSEPDFPQLAGELFFRTN